jgi:hypothetical protein
MSEFSIDIRFRLEVQDGCVTRKTKLRILIYLRSRRFWLCTFCSGDHKIEGANSSSIFKIPRKHVSGYIIFNLVDILMLIYDRGTI